MNLDDIAKFAGIDHENMLAEIDDLPDQLQRAWQIGAKLPIGDISGVRAVVMAGMGGSAIGADLVAAYTSPTASVPIIVWRDYDLPGFVTDQSTLVIASSHSGNTEETLSAYRRAIEVGASVVAVTTGGELGKLAGMDGVPLWRFEHPGQPRAAVGYSFGLLLAMMMRLGLIPDPEVEMEEAISVLCAQQESLQAETTVAKNPAKRMAGQLVGRWPVIIGAGLAAPVARRWRTQIAELAKSVAQYEFLPEADHNMVAGVLEPESLLGSTTAVFLDTSTEHARNQLRTKVTREVLMLEGFGTDIVRGLGSGRMAQQWSLLHFGDYTAYYLAMAYGIDPTPVDAIEDLKKRLKA